MSNFYKTIANEHLDFNRERFIHHKRNTDIYPQKEELIRFYGRQCKRYKNAVKKMRANKKGE